MTAPYWRGAGRQPGRECPSHCLSMPGQRSEKMAEHIFLYLNHCYWPVSMNNGPAEPTPQENIYCFYSTAFTFFD